MADDDGRVPFAARGSRRLAAVASVLALVGAACGSDDDATVTVFAAASLTHAFTELADAFETAEPGADVELSFAGSSSLRAQVIAGAPADVLATADEVTMAAVVAAGLADAPTTFATNAPEIAVPSGNPAAVSGLADLADGDLLIGLCAAEVPCGDVARRALAAAGVRASVDTDEPDVRALLTKIAAGELDAGIVYRTDVRSAGDRVDGIGIDGADEVTTAYPIAVLDDASDPEAARRFVDFVRSAPGLAVLRSHGFGAP